MARTFFAAMVLAFVVVPAAAQSHKVTVVRDVDYVADADYPGGKDRLDIYVPDGARNLPVVFSIHGGALEAGDRREERFVGQRFAGAGYVTVVISYRLSPDVSHPAWVDREGVGPDRPAYVWGTDRRAWIEASPAHYLHGDIPPVLLLDTDGDEPWRQQQKSDFANALRAAGHKDVTVFKVRGRTHMSVWTEMNDGESEETSSQILRFATRLFAVSQPVR